MLGMGACYCRCNATLWKIDKATGEIVWQSDRGAESRTVEIGSDGAIYEGGDSSSTHGAISKWTDNGTSVSNVWDALSSTCSALRMSVVDGVLWAILNNEPNELHRLQLSDGSTLNTGPSDFGSAIGLYDGPSSNMNVIEQGGGRITQYDDTIAQVATRAISAHQAPIGGDSATNGFGTWVSPSSLLHLDNSLTTVATGSGGFGTQNIQVLRDSANATHFLYLRSTTTFGFPGVTTSNIRKIALSTMTTTWESLAYSSGNTTQVDGVLDQSTGDAYVAEIGGSSGVRKLASADGAVEWVRPLGSGSIFEAFLQDDDRVYLIGEFVEDGDNVQAMAINKSDGSIAWRCQLAPISGIVRELNAGDMTDDYIYVAGPRSLLSTL